MGEQEIEQRIRGSLKEGLVRKLDRFYFGRDPLDYDELMGDVGRKLARFETEAYEPDPPDFILTVDKGHGVLRQLEMFSPVDYCVYFHSILSLDACLAQHRIAGTYGGYSIGGPSRVKPPRLSHDGYMEPPSAHPETLARFAYMYEYGNYNNNMIKLIREHPSYNIITLDINNFYDNIRLDLLEQMVEKCSVGLSPVADPSHVEQNQDGYFEPSPDASNLVPNLDPSARIDRNFEVDILFGFLASWNRVLNPASRFSVGLPQDLVGGCSRVLANLYLHPYDRAIKKWVETRRGHYLRYSDDQLILLPKNVDPRLAVREASLELEKLGLHLNLSKLRIFDDPEPFLIWRGVPIYDVLPPNRHGMYTYDEPSANKFAKTFMSSDRRKIYKHGASLVKTVISIGVNKLQPDLRKTALHLINYEYLPHLDQRHLGKLMDDLSEPELAELFWNLDLTLSRQLHTSQKYEALKAVEHTPFESRFAKYLPEIIKP